MTKGRLGLSSGFRFVTAIAAAAILMQQTSSALAYIAVYSDQLMFGNLYETSGELNQYMPPDKVRNPETIFSIGPFDKIVILTDGKPNIVDNKNGLWTIKNVSDAIWQKNGKVSFSSDPEGLPSTSVTLPFNPASVTMEEVNNEYDLTDQLFPNNPNSPRVIFMSDPDPKPPPKPSNSIKGFGSSGGSLRYDSFHQTLTFAGDHIIDTGFANDPATNANVTLPTFHAGSTLGPINITFYSLDNTFLTISKGSTVFLRGRLPTIEYDAKANDFYGPLTDLVFSSSGSPWISGLEALLDPSSPLFDPRLSLFFAFSAQNNLVDLTQQFASSGLSLGSDAFFAAGSVPEPSSALLMTIGLMTLGAGAILEGAPSSGVLLGGMVPAAPKYRDESIDPGPPLLTLVVGGVRRSA